MASPSLFLPSSPFLTSSLLQFKALILGQTQTLKVSVLYFTLSNSHFSIWLALQLSQNKFSKSKPQPPLIPQPTHLSTSNAQPQLPLSTQLSLHSVATAGVQSSPHHCVLQMLRYFLFLIFFSFFFFLFVSLIGLICYGNQMLKSNKPKDL